MTTDMELYITTENSDLTEGRGHTVITGIYTEPGPAVEAVKGREVMGASDGTVYIVHIKDGVSQGPLFYNENMYYGYRQVNGQWGYGYTSEKNDPEYNEYLRLHAKFGKV